MIKTKKHNYILFPSNVEKIRRKLDQALKDR
ncbi:hypothetical protein [Alkalihalophilus lindianensis]